MTLSFCITCWDKDYKFLERLIPYLEEQAQLPDAFIISSSTLTPSQMSSIPPDIAGVEVSLINSPSPLYAGGARNQGASICKTDFITFFDIDDLPHPQKIQITKEALGSGSPDAFVHNFSRGFGKAFKLYSHSRSFDRITENTSIYLQPPHNTAAEVHHGHLSIKPKIVTSLQYKEDMRRGQDSDFCSRVRSAGYSILYSPLPLIKYLPSSVSRVSS